MSVVRVENVGKQYRIGTSVLGYRRLTETLTEAFKPRSPRPVADSHIWALRNISFEVDEGEVVGIIGRNGAGKTTLLKILSRITHPTEGQITLRGRVGALLEVGTGFHPELTGRENIYLNGAILGMSRTDLGRRFDEIVEFAEVERFLDTPVKRYSSGMYIRLAFAVAAHLEPEILIIDEVLAVGDISFQKKCLGKMGDVASEGRTVLFVSHNLAAVRNLCTVGYALENGRVTSAGPIRDVIDDYVAKLSANQETDLRRRPDRQGDGKLRFTRFAAKTKSRATDTTVCGAPVSFHVEYSAPAPPKNAVISMAFFSSLGDGVLHVSNEVSDQPFAEAPRDGVFICSFERLPLLPGRYDINLYCTVNGVVADWVSNAAAVQVIEGDFFGTGRLPPPGYGSVLTPYQWSLADA